MTGLKGRRVSVYTVFWVGVGVGVLSFGAKVEDVELAGLLFIFAAVIVVVMVGYDVMGQFGACLLFVVLSLRPNKREEGTKISCLL